MATAESSGQVDRRTVFALTEKYEDVIKSLEEQNNECQLQTGESSQIIKEIINENSELITELQNSLRQQIELLKNFEHQEANEYTEDLHRQLQTVVQEKDQVLQAWHLALREIERLEQQVEDKEEGQRVEQVEGRAMKDDYITIVTSLNTTINDLREEIRNYETELQAKDAHVAELKLMIESMQEQMNDRESILNVVLDREKGLHEHIKELQAKTTDLQLKATESLKEAMGLNGNNVVLQEHTKTLLSKNAALEMRERELIQQMKESLQIAEDAVLEKDEAHMKLQHCEIEINRLKDALAQIIDEAGLRTKKEVDNVHKTYEKKLLRLEEEMKTTEIKNGELKTEAERASREKTIIENQLQKLQKEYESGDIQKNYQELHNRLVTTEKNANQVFLELDAMKAKMKLLQTSHDKETQNWKMNVQHSEEKIKWLEMECEKHLDGKIHLTCQVESLQAQIQELQKHLSLAQQNIENDMTSMESEKLQQEQMWKNQLKEVEDYYQNLCDELRGLLSEQQKIGIKWKSELKRSTRDWNKRISDVELESAQCKQRNLELSNLLKELTTRNAQVQSQLHGVVASQSYDVRRENDDTDKLKKTLSDAGVLKKLRNGFNQGDN